MKSVFKWLNSNKTSIGAVLLIIYGIPHLEQWIGSQVLDVIYYMGTALGAGGVLHSGVKFQQKRKSRISKGTQEAP